MEQKISQSAMLLKGAVVNGDVEIGDNCSVWFNAVIRGDVSPIKIGKCSNIQDCCVLHTDIDYPLVIGDNVTVGHSAILHGCTVDDNVIIGMGAIVLNGAKIGKNCIIGAGSLVTQDKIIPEGSVVMGSPGAVIRKVTEEEKNHILENACAYVELINKYRWPEKNVIIKTGLEDFEDAAYIRKEVFIKEQGFKNEFDKTDDIARHAVIYVDSKPAAVGRIFPSPEDKKVYIIGRVAVLEKYRRKGLGTEIIKVLEKIALEEGAKSISLSAQTYARDFYKQLGYFAHGEEYYDEHVLHIDMEKNLI